MILIVGLGNPGEEYKGTRHNVGREIVEALAKSSSFKVPKPAEWAGIPAAKSGLGNFHFEKKWNAYVSEGKISREKVVLLLPETFMNRSGNAVAPIARFYKIKPKDIYIIHDDADLPLGRAKLSFGKHSAGHKGVESVIRNLKTIKFWRFRIGIGDKRDIPAEKMVLKKLAPDEEKLVKKIQKKTIEAIEVAAGDGPEYAMNSYNS